MIVSRALGLSLLAACCAAWPATSAQAAVIFDSLGDAANGTGSINNTLGASFSTVGTPSVLTDVKLDLANRGAGGNTITVSLAADSGTAPGSTLALLADVSDSTLSSSGTVVDVPVSGVSLAAGTRYWVVLASPVSTDKWEYSDSDAGIGVAGEYYSDNGVSPNSEGPYLMQVSASPVAAVPEPASLALLGAGLAMVAARRRAVRRA
jgi:hypothetical protein